MKQLQFSSLEKEQVVRDFLEEDRQECQTRSTHALFCVKTKVPDRNFVHGMTRHFDSNSRGSGTAGVNQAFECFEPYRNQATELSDA